MARPCFSLNSITQQLEWIALEWIASKQQREGLLLSLFGKEKDYY